MPAPFDPTAGPVPGEDAIASWIPFGLGADKPAHYREMLEVLWENRDALPYAWRILSQGVCDGCSLGPRGLQDDVIEGTHVCMTRLKLLRLSTMPALDPAAVADIERLRGLDNKALQALGRVPYPFLYRKGDRGFRRISWDEALQLAGERLSATPGPRQAWFATSRGITNETYYVFTKAARLSGTNNVDLCARLCHQASVVGLKATIGYGAPTCSLKDLIGTDLLLLWGTGLANNQPVSMKYLAHAKAAGTRIVVINPLREKGLEAYWVPSMPKSAVFGTKLMDDFVQVNVGGDTALAMGLLKWIVEQGATNEAFIRDHTRNWEAVEQSVRETSWEELVRCSGVPYEQIAYIASLIARARTCISLWSMGITQHQFGTENVEAIANLHLARGLIGRPKTGLVPIRGHSGVQGGTESGVGPNILPGSRMLNAETRAYFSQAWRHPLPEHTGHATVALVGAMQRGEIDFLYNLGGNLFAVMPEPQRVVAAYDRVPFRIHQDIVFNTSTVLEGETVLVLPAQTRYEQRGGGTSTNTERRIRFSPEIPGHPQVGECRPEYEIPCQIALTAFPALADTLSYRDSADIRAEMERTMPLYQGIAGLKVAGDWVQWGGELLCVDGHFPNMPEGRARFQPVTPNAITLPAGCYYLTTRRGKQFNSMVFKDQDRVGGGRRRDDLFISAADLEALGKKDGDRAEVYATVDGREAVFAVVLRHAHIRPGVVQAYWPECNGLIATRVDPRSEEPDYNAVVRIR